MTSGPSFDVVVRGRRVLTPAGEGPRSIGIRDGRIVAIDGPDAPLRSDHEEAFGDDVVVMPGLVDTHVHICAPGTDWEGFASATRAAAADGITTLVDMPIDCVPATTSVDALEVKRAAARGQSFVDLYFWGGAVSGLLDQIPALRRAGVLGFKCFLVDPGVPDFPPLSAGELEEALASVAALEVPLLVHAESPQVIRDSPPAAGPRYADYLASRPAEAENRAIADVIDAARRTRGHAHIVHLSSAEALPLIASARRDGVHLTVESCPHYLAVSAEEIEDGATLFKCSPPIRDAANRNRLWSALAANLINFVVSDHSPSTMAMKHLADGDFGTAWGGISSLQLTLPVVWTAARRKSIPLERVAAWMAERPAAFAGLIHKGKIAEGCDADFCIFAPDERFTVDAARLYHRNPTTPYAGRTLNGVVRETWLRGAPVDFQHARGRVG